MSRCTINSVSSELTKDKNRLMHYFFNTNHSKSAILRGAEVSIEKDIDEFAFNPSAFKLFEAGNKLLDELKRVSNRHIYRSFYRYI